MSGIAPGKDAVGGECQENNGNTGNRALRVRALAIGVESSHREGTASTWTFAKDYLPGQFEATTEAMGINRDLPLCQEDQ